MSTLKETLQKIVSIGLSIDEIDGIEIRKKRDRPGLYQVVFVHGDYKLMSSIIISEEEIISANYDVALHTITQLLEEIHNAK